MIFVTVGTGAGDFRRLLEEVDELARTGVLQDVVAQIGDTTYAPKHCACASTMPRDDVLAHLEAAEFVICNCGVGILNECFGMRKKVIVVPRRAQYGESADDHQLEIATFLAAANRVLVVDDIMELRGAVERVPDWQPASAKATGGTRLVQVIRTFMDESIQRRKKTL